MIKQLFTFLATFLSFKLLSKSCKKKSTSDKLQTVVLFRDLLLLQLETFFIFPRIGFTRDKSTVRTFVTNQPTSFLGLPCQYYADRRKDYVSKSENLLTKTT